MSAGVMLKSLHKVSRYSLAVLKAPLVSSYHTERGVFGYRPRRANSEKPDAELQALLETHSSLNQGQVSSLFYTLLTPSSISYRINQNYTSILYLIRPGMCQVIAVITCLSELNMTCFGFNSYSR